MKIYGKSPENPPGKDNIRKKSNELIVRQKLNSPDICFLE
jgi:hypothetical protein